MNKLKAISIALIIASSQELHSEVLQFSLHYQTDPIPLSWSVQDTVIKGERFKRRKPTLLPHIYYSEDYLIINSQTTTSLEYTILSEDNTVIKKTYVTTSANIPSYIDISTLEQGNYTITINQQGTEYYTSFNK